MLVFYKSVNKYKIGEARKWVVGTGTYRR